MRTSRSIFLFLDAFHCQRFLRRKSKRANIFLWESTSSGFQSRSSFSVTFLWFYTFRLPIHRSLLNFLFFFLLFFRMKSAFSFTSLSQTYSCFRHNSGQIFLGQIYKIRTTFSTCPTDYVSMFFVPKNIPPLFFLENHIIIILQRIRVFVFGIKAFFSKTIGLIFACFRSPRFPGIRRFVSSTMVLYSVLDGHDGWVHCVRAEAVFSSFSSRGSQSGGPL